MIGVFLAILGGWSATALTAEYAIGSCAEDYEQCLARWKNERLEFLMGDDGYLNLAGLFWLDEGINTFGAKKSNDLVFPGSADGNIGKFILENGNVQMVVNSGVEVRLGERMVGRIDLRDDTTSEATLVTHRNLTWTLIRRANKFAVRLRDAEHPALKSFPPIGYFPAVADYRVEAVLERYDEPRIVRVNTVIAGLDYNPQSPGVVKFKLDGEAFSLEAYDAGDELFIVFGDQTSGRETYPAGRFLYARKPAADGRLTLDFNTAHNPPCAFNEFATCPVASPRNRLKTRVEAGESYDPAVHH